MSDPRFWLTEEQLSHMQPLLPNEPRGMPRIDDRRVISGFIHVIRGGPMCRGAPVACGPHKTLCNRFVRWSRAGALAALAAENAAIDAVMIDKGPLKAQCAGASLVKKEPFPAASDAPRAA